MVQSLKDSVVLQGGYYTEETAEVRKEFEGVHA